MMPEIASSWYFGRILVSKLFFAGNQRFLTFAILYFGQ
jgi:hypothetical protein